MNFPSHMQHSLSSDQRSDFKHRLLFATHKGSTHPGRQASSTVINTSILCKFNINNYRWSITVRMVNNSFLCNRRFRPETTEDSAWSEVSHISGMRWLKGMKKYWHDRQRKINVTLKPSVLQYHQFIHHEYQRTSAGTETQAPRYRSGP